MADRDRPGDEPAYVRLRSDVQAITCRPADGPGALVAEVEVRLRWPDGLRSSAPLAGWRSWEEPYHWDGEPLGYLEPGDDQPALLATAQLWVPIAEAVLPAPRRHTAPGRVDVGDAKRAVAAVCRHVNATGGPVVASVQESCGGRR